MGTQLNYTDALYLQKVWEAKDNDTDQEKRISAYLLELVSSVAPAVEVPAIVVKDTEGFLAALNGAKPGDRIVVPKGTTVGPAAGAKVNSITLKGKVFATPVVVTGGGKIVNLNLTDCEGLTFDGMEWFAQVPANTCFNITNCKRIKVLNHDTHGSLNGDPKDDGAAFAIVKCTDVEIGPGRFHELRRGIITNNTKGLHVHHNDFSELATDGIMMAEMDGVSIHDNAFGNYTVGEGEHPDALQCLTKGCELSTQNVEIFNNVMYRDADLSNPSPYSMQGIFCGNESGIPYHNINIHDNLLLGTGYRGISVGGGGSTNIKITDNILLGQSQVINGKVTGIANGIYCPGVDGLVVKNNRSSVGVGLADDAKGKNASVNVEQSNNTITTRAATVEQVKAEWDAWKAKGGFMPQNLKLAA